MLKVNQPDVKAELCKMLGSQETTSEFNFGFETGDDNGG